MTSAPTAGGDRGPRRARRIVLRGPLGAGKSTVARALAREIGALVIPVDDLLDELGWDGGSERLFLRANDVIARRARPVLANGRRVIIDGNFYWRSALDDLSARLPYPGHVFRLEVPLATCIERDRDRTESHGAVAAREVYVKVARVPIGERIDGRPPVAVIVRAIRAALDRDPA